MNRPRLHLKFNSEGQDMPRKSVAEKAMEETAYEVGKPNFERALRVIRHDIDPVSEHIATRRGDLSAAWKIIADECHVNKTAARWYRKLKGASAEQRDDIRRSFDGLMAADPEMEVAPDLVDRMVDGGAPFAPAPQNAKPEPRAPFDDAELDGVVGDVPDRGGLSAAEVDAMDGDAAPAPEKRRKPLGKPTLVSSASYN